MNRIVFLLAGVGPGVYKSRYKFNVLDESTATASMAVLLAHPRTDLLLKYKGMTAEEIARKHPSTAVLADMIAAEVSSSGSLFVPVFLSPGPFRVYLRLAGNMAAGML